MARIKKSKNGESWVVSWQDTTMSRSKSIDDYNKAMKFKELVEDAEETMPTTTVLAENDLLDCASWFHPGVLIQMREMLKAAANDQEAVTHIRVALDLILDTSR